MMKEICIRKLNIKLNDGSIEPFHAHLILDKSEENSEITLKLFLHDERRFYKIGSYLIRSEDDDLISVDGESINDIKIKSINISNKKLFSYTDNSNFYEKGTKYQLLYFKEALVEYEIDDYEISESGIYQSTFYLSKQAIPLIADDYSFMSSKLGKWEAVNRNGKFRKFDKLRYKLIMLFNQKENFFKNEKLVINREPVLQLRYRLKELDVPKYANFLVKLLSFYITELVDYYYGFYFVGNSKYAHYKVVNNDSIKSRPNVCHHSEYQNIYQFFSSMNGKKAVILEYELIEKLIEKFILASKLDGESKFMLYFSIFEGVRNYYVKKQMCEVKENFSLTSNWEEIIERRIQEIIPIVDKSEKELFKKSISGKVTNVRRFPMKEQMDTFLKSKSVNINPSDFDLNFKKVLRFRHRIFHGNFVKNNQELKEINLNMPKFSAKFIRLITNQKDVFDFNLEEKKCLIRNDFKFSLLK